MKSKSLEELKRIANYPIDLGIDNSYEPPKSCGTVSIGLCFQEEFDLIKKDLEELNKLKTLVQKNCVGFTLEQVVEKGLYQIYLEQMCDIMCPEPEEEEEEY